MACLGTIAFFYHWLISLNPSGSGNYAVEFNVRRNESQRQGFKYRYTTKEAEQTMKKACLLVLFCSITGFGAFAAVQVPGGVALRYVTAAEAATLVKQQLGVPAAGAVSSVDEKRNLIALDAAHAQAPIVRAFLTGLDNPPPEVQVDATVTERSATTAATPRRDQVVSHRTFLSQAGRPEILSVPGDPKSTEIELRITHLGK